MSNEIFSYFEQELRFFREQAIEFSERYPESAKAIGINDNNIEDPDVSRLIESVALLNGRLQQRLDNNYPELTSSLLTLLFPHYLRPVPSYSMLNFSISKDANAAHSIPKNSEFEISNELGQKAIFRTANDLTLYPIKIRKLDISFSPFSHTRPAGTENANTLFQLTIETIDKAMDFSLLNIKELDLYLNGDNSFVFRLFDFISYGASQVVIRDDNNSFVLGKEALKPLGFFYDENILPYQASSFGGYKLLTEFFMFPNKFNGFRLSLDTKSKKNKILNGNKITIDIYIDDFNVDINRNIKSSNFLLFTIPVINLHQQLSEPVEINLLQNDYPININTSQDEKMSVFCVNEVIDTTDTIPSRIPSLYNEKFNSEKSSFQWQLYQNLNQYNSINSTLHIACLNPKEVKTSVRIWILDLLIIDDVNSIRLSKSSEIKCRENLMIPATIKLLKKPSQAIYEKDTKDSVWALLSHLHFNYHGLFGSEDPASELKKMLQLYNFNDNLQNINYIDSIKNIELEQIVVPIRVSGRGCFSYGTKVQITLDFNKISNGIMLFSHLLDHFFSFFAGMNSFTQVNIYQEGKEGVYISFPRRIGCKTIL